MFEFIVVLLLIFMTFNFVKTLINLIVGEQTQNNSAITYHDGVPGVQAVSARREPGLQLSAPGASDIKASGKVIKVRITKNRQTQSTTSHDDDGSVTAVFSARRKLGPQVIASNISQLSSQVVAGPIPPDGPTIQAAIRGLLETLETIDIHHHNIGVIDGLTARLYQLSKYLRNTPTIRDVCEEDWKNELTSVMQSTSDRLKKLNKRSTFVKLAIIGCSEKLQQYLDDHKFSIIEECGIQQFRTSYIPGAVTSGSLILMDAIGHEHEIPFEIGMSLQQLNKMLKCFFAGQTEEALIQRQYMQQGQYDLCIDQETQVTVLTSDKNEWPTMEPGTKIVMRVIFEKSLMTNSQIKCDSCGHSDFSLRSIRVNNNTSAWTVHCRVCQRRYQLSITNRRSSRDIDVITNHAISPLIRNINVQECSEDRWERAAGLGLDDLAAAADLGRRGGDLLLGLRELGWGRLGWGRLRGALEGRDERGKADERLILGEGADDRRRERREALEKLSQEAGHVPRSRWA